MIFTSGDFGKVQKVLALSLDGKLLWETQNGESSRAPTLTHPVVFNGRLYLRGGTDLFAYDVRGSESK